MKLNFTKAHGLGNDMIIFDSGEYDLIEQNAEFLCNRKYGIGADGVILHNSGEVHFWNSDGSKARLCGNGCRCLIKHLAPNGKDVSFYTEVGTVNGKVKEGLVYMSYPARPFISIEDGYYFVNVGNQHLVIFGEDDDSIENHLDEVDTTTTNIMFLRNKGSEWFMDVYEAGAGITNSCGSGAMASSIAIWDRDKHNKPIKISMKGGTLHMSQDEGLFYQEGPAEIVFSGQINL